MSNDFFKINSPEEFDEVQEKWRNLSSTELRTISVSKSRIYVSVADMDMLLEGLESIIELKYGQISEGQKRRIMQMGYSLQEIKERLIKRIEREAK